MKIDGTVCTRLPTATSGLIGNKRQNQLIVEGTWHRRITYRQKCTEWLRQSHRSHTDMVISAAQSTYAPDVVTYLDLPLDEAAKRIGIREDGSAGYEEDDESLKKFSDDYEQVIANPPHRLRHTTIEYIDASQDSDTLAASIAAIAFRHLDIYAND